MSLARPTGSKNVRTAVLEQFEDECRRRLLAVLLDRSAPLSVEELASDLAAAEQRERSALRIELVHRHLPALVDSGLVERDRDAGTVATTDDPALADPALRRILSEEGDGVGPAAACLANDRRRAALAVLERRGPMPLTALARAVAGRAVDGEPSPDAVEETLVALHHVHLPKLADASLVEYDGETATVGPRDDGAFESAVEFYGDD